MRIGFPKPMRGSALLERKERRANVKAHETREMQAALKRDGRKCRWPGCNGKYRGLTLPIDACHQKHRGSGGNPDGTRTTRQTIISLCRRHHGLWDSGLIKIEPRFPKLGFDGQICCEIPDDVWPV